MNVELVKKIADAVLYEGYLLYPYRASAIKNQRRFNFGVLYPREHCELQQGSDAWQMQTECLIIGNAATLVEVKMRFLQLVALGERQEGLEREVDTLAFGLEGLVVQPVRQRIIFEAEIGAAGTRADAARKERIDAELELTGVRMERGLYKVKMVVRNCATMEFLDSGNREEILLRSLVSVHAIFHAPGGAFISLMDPPNEFRQAAAECRNIGTWPVLVGDEGQRDLLLSSPIILYDFPEVAPESPGDHFDGLEIDEILALRILTLTDEEKQEVRNGDDRARAILERTESLPPEHLQRLHGALRGLRGNSEASE